jgi:hypothetical protein
VITNRAELQSKLSRTIAGFALVLCIVANAEAATVVSGAGLQSADFNVYTYHNPFEVSSLKQNTTGVEQAATTDGAVLRGSLVALSMACGLSILALASIFRFEYLRYRLSKLPAADGRICDVFVESTVDNVPKVDVIANSGSFSKSTRPTCLAPQNVMCRPRFRTVSAVSVNRLRRFQN